MALAGEKDFLPLIDLRPVEAGHYPEVSVKHLYDEFSVRPEIQKYMAPKLNKGRTLDKEYFFNIVNSHYSKELQSILKHASVQRNTEQEVQEKRESILMSEKMAELMFAQPFM